jgi:hypothetical protein
MTKELPQSNILLICEMCYKKFYSEKSAREHAQEKHHHTFKLGGTELCLNIG